MINNKDDEIDKLSEFYRILVQWLSLKQQGINLSKYFAREKYATIAIYGMKELGQLLLEEIYNEPNEPEVKYVIDRNPDGFYAPVPSLKPEDELPEVDVIVITAVHYFKQIREALVTKVECPIISLEDIVFDL